MIKLPHHHYHTHRFLDNIECTEPLVDEVVWSITDHHETIHTETKTTISNSEYTF